MAKYLKNIVSQERNTRDSAILFTGLNDCVLKVLRFDHSHVPVCFQLSLQAKELKFIRTYVHKVAVSSCFRDFSHRGGNYTMILYWSEFCVLSHVVNSHLLWEWDPSSFLPCCSDGYGFNGTGIYIQRKFFPFKSHREIHHIFFTMIFFFFMKSALYLCLPVVGINLKCGKL